MDPTVSFHDWQPAPFAIGNESIFAIGDVHGCARHLAALLQALTATATPAGNRRRLVYLGDMVDRGPDNIGALKLWAEDETARGVDRIDRVIGNHEIIMLLTFAGEAHADKAEAMWLSEAMGGMKVLDEMRAACRDPAARPTLALAREALGGAVMKQLLAQRSHVRVGNVLFVHGGLDGGADAVEFLAPAWTEFTEARWAWITRGFLDWKAGFNGTIVVHGHTPPAKHFPLTGMVDPHLFHEDRLGLDGGSALTGRVTAAQIESGRYRIFEATAV